MSNNYVEIADAKYDGARNKVFDTLGQRLNQDSADLKSLQEQINDISSINESYIDQLNTKINQANSDIDNLEGSIANINQTISQNANSINSDISAIEGSIGSLQDTKINKPTSTISNNIPRFSSTSGDLKSSGVSVDDYNNLSANTIISTVAQGTAPIQVTSTTKVANLNTDLLDGYSAEHFLRFAQLVSSIGTNGDSGYFKIPTDSKTLILQWGLATSGTANSSTGVWASFTPVTNFTIPFQEKIIYANGNVYQTGTSWTSGVVTTLSTIQVFLNSNNQIDANNRVVRWFAIGY